MADKPILPNAPERPRVEALAGDDVVTIYNRAGIINVAAADISGLVGELVCAGSALATKQSFPFAAKKVVH